MKVTISHAPLPGLPPLTGPHELAWSYILDTVFADAYHAEVAHLDVVIPRTELVEAVEIRAEVSATCSQTGAKAMARLGGPTPIRDPYGRVYDLGFGGLASATLRSVVRDPLDGMAMLDEIRVFTIVARAWGVPIRLASLWRRRDLVDRMQAAMRHGFAAGKARSSYYVLQTWGRQ